MRNQVKQLEDYNARNEIENYVKLLNEQLESETQRNERISNMINNLESSNQKVISDLTNSVSSIKLFLFLISSLFLKLFLFLLILLSFQKFLF